MLQRISETKPVLAIIIPLRQNDNIDVIERLGWKHIPSIPEIEVIVVDDGSLNSDDIQAFCTANGWRYLFLRTTDAPFSLARARNAGIKAASAEFVYFEDVDFLHQSNFYRRLIKVCKNLDASPFNFAAIPTLFLTPQASSALIEVLDDREELDARIDDYVARLPFVNPDTDNEICASFAPVGSNIALRRSLCFHVGLFDEYFNSWGGEDRDFVYRLLQHNGFLTRPANFSSTKPWPIHRTNAYEGWRAAYRLHGDWLRSIGLYAVHIYHSENGWKDQHARRANFTYAETKAKDLDAGRQRALPTPITDAPLNIFIGRNPVFYNDAVMDLLGSVSVVEPDRKIDPVAFALEIAERQPERVFFQNPYGNEWLLSVWKQLRRKGVRCICAERGALPWSIYFDEDGFCCESSSYDKDRWQDAEPIDAAKYLAELRAGGQFLEPQGKNSTDELRSFLDPKKRTVLILLQSLTDATTLHFSKPMADYTQFLGIMRGLTESGKFNILVKNHPLNKDHPLPNCGISVDAYPIYDLYDVADTVVTLNSGAGMLALAAGLPVVTLGTAFYAHEGLAASATNLQSLINQIERGNFVDRSSVDRFFGYLIGRFYSFAEWTYGSRDYSEKTKMSTMAGVRYQKIVIGELCKSIQKRPLDRYSLIMDPYAFHQFSTRKSNGSKSVTTYLSPKEVISNGRAAYRSGQFSEAASFFDQLPPSDKSAKTILRYAAEAHYKAGNTSEAIARLKAAAEIAPNNKSIARRMREMNRPNWVRRLKILKETPYPVE